MWTLWMVLSTLAWGAPEKVPVVQADESLLVDRLNRAFSMRDNGPTCQEVGDWGQRAEVRDAMIQITAEITMPPWSPMRAANCVASMASTDDVAWRAVRGWMRDPATPGFSLMVLKQLDSFGEPKAIELGEMAMQRASLQPRFARLVRPHLVNSRHEPVAEMGLTLK